jgi:phytoene/squalene synthetase
MSGGKSSFYWPMRLAPEPQRSGLFAIYAWCRYMDDIIDGDLPPDDKASALALWRDYFLNERSATTMDGEGLMIAMTLNAAMAAHDLPATLFLRVLNGMEMDLAGEMRAPSMAMLDAYAHAVASAPGELCLNVLGWRGEPAAQFSRALGEAVQYTNILRDVEEDAVQGRLYLPREALDSAGIAAQDPAIVISDKRLADAWLVLALVAEAKFHLADSLLPDAAMRRKIRAALAMMAVYRLMWRKLRARGWKPGAPKVSIPPWRAMLAAARAAWLA